MRKEQKKTKEGLVLEVKNLKQQVAELRRTNITFDGIEQKLQDSLDEYKSIFENVRDGIVLLSLSGKILHVNKRITDVGGFSKDEIVGKRFSELKMFPLKSKIKMAARFTKEIAGIETGPLEVESYTNSGKKINIEIYGSIFQTKDKRKISVAILRDITERKKLEKEIKKHSAYLEQEVKKRTAELNITNKRLKQEIINQQIVAEELKNYEKRLEIIFEYAPDAYYLHDWRGNFIDGNREAEKIIGYKKEELIGKNFLKLKLLIPKDIPRAAANLAQNLKGRSTGPDEFCLLTKDGKKLTLEIRTYPVKIKGKTMVLGIARDITTRKKQEDGLERYRSNLEEMVQKRTAELKMANERLEREIDRRLSIEEELRKSEEKYRLIAEGTNDLIAITTFSLNPNYIYISPSHRTVMGYDSDDMIGKSCFKFIHPNDKKKLFPILKRYFEKLGKKIITKKDMEITETIEYRAKDKSGEFHCLESTVNLIGKHLLTISRDITERKQAEKEKKELQAQLLHSQRLESMGRLAGGIAHEFNNILACIMGYADMLKMNNTDKNQLVDKAADIIYKSTDRAKELTNGLLGFARKGKYNPISLNINDVLKETIKVSEKIFEKNIKLNYDLDIRLDSIKADKNQVEQVLTNLIINAKDAMPESGEITFKTENVCVEKSNKVLFSKVIKPGYYIKISISDTGIGMSKETRMRIFDPFFTTKEIGKGTGLGLATVYGIIKNHYGYIFCSSKPGRGTTFDIYMPSEEKEVRENKEKEAKNGLSSRTILVADDEEWVLAITEDLLERLGYNVLLAANGNKAVELFKKNLNKIDLVLLDVIMPGMDGKETFRVLKKINPHIKVLLFSGFSKNEKIRDLLEEGAIGFLKKPFNFNALAIEVSKAFNN